jgi:prepilin peptidase CpaA
MTVQVWIAILVGLAATIDDLARRQIANWIPAAALAAGFGWQIGQNGVWPGAGYALGGAAAGFGVFLIFYLMGGMGGGDVKLMTGFGALLGAPRLLEAALWTAGIGGVLALGVLAARAARRVVGRPGTHAGLRDRTRGDASAKPAGDQIAGAMAATLEAQIQEEAQMKESIPYAPAITLGVWLSLVPKG